MMDDRRSVQHKLGELDEMIRGEDDPKDRNVLLVLHCLTSTILSIAKSLEDIISVHDTKFTSQAEKIERHENLTIQGKVIWKIVASTYLAASVYGYTLIADLRDTVNRQSLLLPRLELAINDMKKTVLIGEETRSGLTQQMDTVQQQDRRINELNAAIASINKLKAIKGSK